MLGVMLCSTYTCEDTEFDQSIRQSSNAEEFFVRPAPVCTCSHCFIIFQMFKILNFKDLDTQRIFFDSCISSSHEGSGCSLSATSLSLSTASTSSRLLTCSLIFFIFASKRQRNFCLALHRLFSFVSCRLQCKSSTT